jgi:hypothetical protein
MKKDPYRELAEKHRKVLRTEKWSETEEEDPPILSRTEYRKQKKQEKRVFSILHALLILFIFLPVLIFFSYNTLKEREHPLSSVSIITEESASGEDQERPNATKKPIHKKSGQVKTVTHTVQPNETLADISIQYYGTKDGIERIKLANHLEGNDIQAGQVLKIPLKK